MTHKLSKNYGDITVTVEGDSQFEAVKMLSFYDDVLSNRTCIGKDDQGNWVSSEKTIFVWRKDREDNEYLSMRCVESRQHPLSGYQAAIGKLKKPEGMVFFNQKVPEGQDGIKGWYKYDASKDPKRGGGNYNGGQSVPSQQSNYNPGGSQNSYQPPQQQNSYQPPQQTVPSSEEDIPF